MANDTHPDLEQLIQFCEKPAVAEQMTTALHLSRCGDCRNIVTTIQALLNNLNAISSIDESEASKAYSDDDIIALITGTLDVTMEQELRQQMMFDHYLLKRVVHFSSQSFETSKGESLPGIELPSKIQLNSVNTESLQPITTTSITDKFSEWFKTSISARIAMPVISAAAAVMLTVSILVSEPQRAGMQLVAYQDDPTVSIFSSAPTPGMGFFTKSEAQKESFTGVNIQLINSSQIQISWPAVKEAESYSISVSLYENTRLKPLTSANTNTTSATLNITVKNNSRYEWLIEGKTKGGGEFRASGGFVANINS